SETGRVHEARGWPCGERALEAVEQRHIGLRRDPGSGSVPEDVGEHQKVGLIQSMCERSSRPTSSTSVLACSARMRLKFSWPARFSAIHSRAKAPDWISPRILRMLARVSSVITRLPR